MTYVSNSCDSCNNIWVVILGLSLYCYTVTMITDIQGKTYVAIESIFINVLFLKR